MNYKKAVLLLLHILDDYGEHFLFHDLFLAELESLLKGSLKGNESSFFKALTKTLKKAVFLVCFNEKSGKKISSYQKYINVMIRRLDEMEE